MQMNRRCLRLGRLHIHRHRWLGFSYDDCSIFPHHGFEWMLTLGVLTLYWTGNYNYDIGCGNA